MYINPVVMATAFFILCKDTWLRIAPLYKIPSKNYKISIDINLFSREASMHYSFIHAGLADPGSTI